MLLPYGVMALACMAACGRGESATGWRGTIDTLSNGAIVVKNPEKGSWDSTAAWWVVEELRIGSADGEGPDGFNRIADLAVDPLGRMYVLEREAQEIRVFDSTGTFVRTVGRKGRGPGEFDQAIGMRWDPSGRLWVVDQATFDTR